MASLVFRLRALGVDQRGFTFPELIVSIVIGLITVGTAMVVLQMTLRMEPEMRERSGQLQQGRVMVERVTRELRQGEFISAGSGSSLEIVTFVHSGTCGGAPSATAIQCLVTYSCSSSSCTRTERNPDGSGTPSFETVVTGISGPAVFGYSPSAADPAYVSASLVFPGEDGDEAVTVSDGVSLRNYVEGAS